MRRVALESHLERLELPDGDFVDLVWSGAKTDDEAKPVVVILHGLEGSIESSYVRRMLNAVVAHGWRGVLMVIANTTPHL